MDCTCWHSHSSASSSSSAASSSSSPLSRCSSASSLIRSFPADEPSDYCRPTLSVNTRLNESQRLAVLLDRSLWTRDSDADICQRLQCETRFSMLERRHHCRKCGGIFCQACSSQSYPLLDTTKMPFLIPPSHVPQPLLNALSPAGTIVPSRVCDDCFATLSGDVAPSTVVIRTASAAQVPIPEEAVFSPVVPSLSHSPGSDAASIHSGTSSGFPSGTTFVAKPRHLRRPHFGRAASSPLIPTRRDSSSTHHSLPRSPSPTSSTAASTTNFSDLGVLSEYPLKVPSAGCKSMGAAFWHPKPLPRRLDSPIRYDAPGRRGSALAVSVREADDDDVEDVDDEGAAPVVPVRRVIRTVCREIDISKAPFATPDMVRDADCVSTF